MNIKEIAPGFFGADLTDEERRDRYTLSNADEIMDTLYTERDKERLMRTETGFKAKLRTVGEHILFGPPQIRPDADFLRFQQLVEQNLKNVTQKYADTDALPAQEEFQESEH